MPRALTLNEVKQRIYNCHGNVITLVESTFVNMRTKARFIDSEFGEWETTVGIVVAGSGHPKRKAQRIATSKLITLQEAQHRIMQAHGSHVMLVPETYVSACVKASFIDDVYGLWETLPYRVWRGHCHPHRGIINSNKRRLSIDAIPHWKTGEPCHSQSSWEAKTLRWLNYNQYDYDWQVPFRTALRSPSGRQLVYIIDVFIKTGPFEATYVEIKGSWDRYKDPSKRDRSKWEWFNSTYPNSQLWMRPELEALEIL